LYGAPSGSRSLPWIVLSAVMPSAFGLLGLFSWDEATSTLKAAGADDSILNGMSDYVAPFVQMASGAVNTGVGIAYQVETGDTYWVDIADIARNGNEGIGKPEPLNYGFQGYWSRRITDEHRLVCKIVEDEIRIAACRYHYEH
jgi:Txe/YoeB family toxin of toxin-antitoxin system